jgi:hypothetical protein
MGGAHCDLIQRRGPSIFLDVTSSDEPVIAVFLLFFSFFVER